ncbi:MAG: spore coat protein [Acetanaerobacterium sp.]
MSQLNHIELQNLRHLIGSHDTATEKMQTYAQQCQDPQVKQYFQQSAQDAQQTKQKLMSFLN